MTNSETQIPVSLSKTELNRLTEVLRTSAKMKKVWLRRARDPDHIDDLENSIQANYDLINKLITAKIASRGQQ